MNYNIGKAPFQDYKWSAGFGYITYPLGVDRDQFITASILEGRVCMKTEDGGYHFNCPVSRNIFNEIKWPENPTENGTPVFYVTEPIDSQPVILGAFNFSDQIVDIPENTFKISKEAENKLVQISGNVDSISELLFVVKSIEKSKFIVNILNEANEGEVEFDVDGVFNINTIDNINLVSQKEIFQKVGKSTTSQTTSNYQMDVENTSINTSKFTINEGSESMVLGDKLKSFLETLIDEIARSTVATPQGPAPLINSAQITLLKTRLSGILSEISFID